MKHLLFFLLFFMMVSFVQAQKTVIGMVSDESGEVLIGANVVAKDAAGIGTITDIDGHYKLVLPADIKTLVFSYAGFDTKEVEIGQSGVIDVVLSAGKLLDEVVVVGYGTQRKSDVTSSITKIGGSDVAGLVTPSFATQLAGRASGVQVTTQSGILGQAPRVRIRGVASVNSGTAPLYVIDGMPMLSGDLGGYADANGLGDINPNDIESYEVLKDGAATAVYGSRAANGVILITTKKGKKGDAKVTLNSVFGVANAVKKFDLLETPDFITISNEKRTNRGQAAWAVGNENNTDWQGAVLNSNAFQMDHTLSVSGGSEKTTYYLSGGYNTQNSVAKGNDMSRYNMRMNLDHKLNKWLTVGANLSATKTNYTGLNTGRNSLSGNIFNATRQLPNTPIYNTNHPTGYNLSTNNTVVGQWDNTDPVGDNISNIVFVLDHNTYKSSITRLMSNAYASVDLLKGLTYKIQGSVDNPTTSGFLFWSPVHGDGAGSNGRLQNSQDTYLRWNLQHILNYNTLLSEKHSLGLTAVAEYQKERYENFYSEGTDLLNEFYNQVTVSNSYATQASGGGASENGIISYLGRVNYNYDQKYFVQASLRRDGLSKLSEDNRWSNFIGYSLGWNVVNESFMEGARDIFNQIKLRYSFSSVGNTEIGNYPYLGLAGASPYGDLNGIGFRQFGNDALSWEKSDKSDFGIDLGLFNNKIKFTFDYFNNNIDKLVFNEPVAPSLGVPFNTIAKNIGKSLNKGYEFGVDYNVIESTDFTWTVSTNLTLMSNKIVALPNGGADIVGGSSSDVNINPNIIIREGESMNSLYGFNYYGVNPANGNPVYYKADGTLVEGDIATSKYYVFDPANPSVKGEASSLSAASDKVILGKTLPTYFGGINSKFKYKNFDLGLLVRFSGGNKIFNSTRRDLFNQNLNNNTADILGRWQSPENPGDGQTPKLWASSNTFVNLTSAATTRFVESGDFVSIDNITFGYGLPSSLTKKWKIQSIRAYVQGQNVLMLTKYKGLNPEMETLGVDLNGTPRARIMSLGISVNF